MINDDLNLRDVSLQCNDFYCIQKLIYSENTIFVNLSNNCYKAIKVCMKYTSNR